MSTLKPQPQEMRSDLTGESDHPSCLPFFTSHSLTLWHLSSLHHVLAVWKLVVPKFSVHQDYLESLLEHRLLGFTPSVSDSVDLEWGPIICISNQFPGAAALGTSF